MLYINKEYLPKINMSIWLILATISFAALLHASFQLGVSLLLMIGSHSIGAKRAPAKTIRLVLSYVLGVAISTTIIFASFGYAASLLFELITPLYGWIITASACVAIGGSVMLFYFRKSGGTQLWLPRQFADYLGKQAKKATRVEEAFTLGVMSVLIELIFIAGPISVAILSAISLPAWGQAAGLALYVSLACLPLIILALRISNRGKISSLQRWREQNKRFLQYAAGSGLVVLGLYVFITEVVGATLEGILLT